MTPRLRLPDFIIGGAPRSGTTWLSTLLDLHPGLFMAKPARPEPKFFFVDDIYERGLAFYSRQWFAEVPADIAAGEKSTAYLESATAAERIVADLPEVKMIFVLREPAERAWSNYRWSVLNGQETETFEAALALESRREATYADALRFVRPHSYFSRGLYADLLAPYLEGLGRRQVLCLRHDDVVASPERIAADAHAFLEVEARPQDAARLGVVNPSPAAEAPASTLAGLRDRYRASNARLAKLLGPDFEVWEDV